MEAPRISKGEVARRGVPELTIRGVKTAVVEAPMNFPLGTSAAILRAAPLLLVDLLTEEGVIGRTYLFCYRRSGAKAIAALLEDAVDVVRGQPAVPLKIGQVLGRRFALLGVTGLARMARAALDGRSGMHSPAPPICHWPFFWAASFNPSRPIIQAGLG